MKYTFINEQGKEQTINIPESVFVQGKKERLNNAEIIERYLSDEGYILNEVVKELCEKQKRNGVGVRASSGTRKPPTRKPDEVKRNLIAVMAEFLGSQDKIKNLEVTNIERMIAFSVGEDNFEVVLQKKRKPKV